MYSRNWNKGFGKRRTILQLDGDADSSTKNLPRTGSSNALTALGSYDNGDEDEEEQSEQPPPPPEPVTDPSPPPEAVNGTGQREVTPSPTDGATPQNGGDIDMQVANFLAEIESIDVPEEEEEEVEKEEEVFDIPEPKCLWQQCLDEGTQCYYYWHMDTNEVTWEIPDDYTRYLLQYKEYEEAFAAFEARKAAAPEAKKKQKVKSIPVPETSSSRTASPAPAAVLPESVPLPEPEVGPQLPDTIGPQLPAQAAFLPESKVEGPQLPESSHQAIGPQLFAEYGDSPISSPSEHKTLYGHLAKYANNESNDGMKDSIGPKVHLSRSGLGASSGSNSPLVHGYDSDPAQEEFNWFQRDQRERNIVKKEEKKPFAMKFVKGTCKTLDEEKDDLKTKVDEAPSTKAIDRNELLQRIRTGGSSWLKAKKEVGPQLPGPGEEGAGASEKVEEDEEAMLEKELERRKAELEQLEAIENESGVTDSPMTPETNLKRESPDPESVVTTGEEKPPPAKKIKTEKEADSSSKEKLGQEQETMIDQLSSTITSKLEFLDITRKGLSKLQILLIETQTRLVDWVEGGLSTDHLLKKLKDADQQIKQYELGAAPKGWSCHWDRIPVDVFDGWPAEEIWTEESGERRWDYKRYFYQSNETGASQWEYPADAGAEASSSALQEVDSSEGRNAQNYNGIDGEAQDITSTFTEDQDRPSLPDETIVPPPPGEPSDQPPLPPEPEPPPLPPSSPPPPPSSPPPPLPLEDQPAPPPDTLQPPPPPPGFESNFVPPPPPPILSSGYSPPPLPPGTEAATYLPHSPIQEVDMEIDDNEVDSTVPDLQPPPMPPFTTSSISSSYNLPMSYSYQSTAYHASTTSAPDYMAAPPPPPPPSGADSEDSQDIPSSSISRLPALDKPAHLSAQPVLFRSSQTSASSSATLGSMPTTYAPDTTTISEVAPEPNVPSTSQMGGSASQLALNLAASVSESGKKKKKDKIKMKSGGALSLKKKNVSSLVQKWQKAQQEVEKEIAQAAARANKDNDASS